MLGKGVNFVICIYLRLLSHEIRENYQVFMHTVLAAFDCWKVSLSLHPEERTIASQAMYVCIYIKEWGDKSRRMSFTNLFIYLIIHAFQ